MKRIYLVVPLLLAFSGATLLAQRMVAGDVVGDGLGPVPGATVRVPLLGIGVISSSTGRFTIANIPPGHDSISVVITAVGYHDTTLLLPVAAAGSSRIVMRTKVALSDPVVVTGNRVASYVKNLPVKVEVISSRDLHKIHSIDVSAACEYTPGLTVQNNCGVCGTNEIRTQGLPGQYSQVLINGHPIVSNLGMVYGLMGISTSSIRQVEIVKGPGQVLFGPEAIGGTINIIMKRPAEMPLFAVETSISSNQEHQLALTGTHRWQKVATSLAGSYAGSYHRRDRNGDGFTDAPLFQRLALTNGWSGEVGDETTFDLTGRLYSEDRFGGEMDWNAQTDRGSGRVYGESIRTFRQEVFGGIERELSPQGIVMAHISQTYHMQDSYYGSTPYRAYQFIGYGDILGTYRFGGGNRLTVGTAYKYERYDDNTPATASEADTTRSAPSLYHIASVFAEGELVVADPVRLLLGLRYNHHNVQGGIWQPRANLKIDLASSTILRLSAGTGFRSVNIFTEDHAALSGYRRLIIQEQLQPERSINGSAGIIHDLDLGDQFARVTVDAFHTRFSNRIIPDYDTDPNAVIYRNLNGYSIAQGAEAGIEYQFAFPLRVKLGYEWLEAYQVQDGIRSALKYTPRDRIFWELDYDWAGPALDMNIVGKWVGRQALPEFPEPFLRPGVSEPYAIWNAQVSHAFGRTELFAGVSNIFDYRQESPLVDPGNPFGEYFDTSYVYGPLEGRTVFLGMRTSVN